MQKKNQNDKGRSSQSYGFSCTHVWIWELDHKEGWTPKNLCSWAVVLTKTLESPMDSKKIKPVNPKGNQPWMFIGRTDGEAEVPILWPPDAKNRHLGKPLMLGKTEGGWSRGWQRTRRLNGITDSVDMSLSKLWGMAKDRKAWPATVHGVTKSCIGLRDWKTRRK